MALAAQQQQRGRAAGGTPAVVELPAEVACPDFTNLAPLRSRPAFAWGLRTLEIFAGTGRWTQAMKNAGVATSESV
eukprot:8321825-Pyramimonas_sp.AAC.1